MPGTLHIFTVGKYKNQYGRTVPEYQASYASARKQLFPRLQPRAYSEDKLEEFLRNEVVLAGPALSRVLADLHAHGRPLSKMWN